MWRLFLLGSVVCGVVAAGGGTHAVGEEPASAGGGERVQFRRGPGGTSLDATVVTLDSDGDLAVDTAVGGAGIATALTDATITCEGVAR